MVGIKFFDFRSLNISSNVSSAIRAMMICVFARVHTIRHTNTWPAAVSNEKGRNKTFEEIFFCFTYRKRHKNRAMTCVFVVALCVTLVLILAWQLGHCSLDEFGPTATLLSRKTEKKNIIRPYS